MLKADLIVGATGLLGQALMRVRAEGGRAIKTMGRSQICDVQVDLSDSSLSWPIIEETIEAAFLGAAMTSQSECERNYDLARRVNVHNTLALIDKLTAEKAHVIFPSTNLVLAGANPFQKKQAPLDPQGAYAALKADVECAVASNPHVTVVRLGKVLSAGAGLIAEWIRELCQKRPIHAFKDMVFAPVSVDHVTGVLNVIMDDKPVGVWQISGSEELTYYDFAIYLAKHLEVSETLVIPDSVADKPGVHSGVLHPSLDTSDVKTVYGISPQCAEAVIDDLLEATQVRP